MGSARFILTAILLIQPLLSFSSKTERKAKVGSGVEIKYSNTNWHFERMDRLHPQVDAVLHSRKDQNLKVYSSYTVDRLEKNESFSAYLKRLCSARKGELLRGHRGQLCRVTKKEGREWNLQFVELNPPKRKRADLGPWTFVQYWTSPALMSANDRSAVEALFVGGQGR